MILSEGRFVSFKNDRRCCLGHPVIVQSRIPRCSGYLGEDSTLISVRGVINISIGEIFFFGGQ